MALSVVYLMPVIWEVEDLWYTEPVILNMAVLITEKKLHYSQVRICIWIKMEIIKNLSREGSLSIGVPGTVAGFLRFMKSLEHCR